MRIVELSAPGVHKAAGVAAAARLLGRDPADVLAFGDAPNDVEMLMAAAWGVAMGNGHPDVVAIADEQTASNDDDGVAVVLERLLRVSSDACT
jgi:hydroxymethylpyrimidine pyrophosphatase-like HAD family hydrolase